MDNFAGGTLADYGGFDVSNISTKAQALSNNFSKGLTDLSQGIGTFAKTAQSTIEQVNDLHGQLKTTATNLGNSLPVKPAKGGKSRSKSKGKKKSGAYKPKHHGTSADCGCGAGAITSDFHGGCMECGKPFSGGGKRRKSKAKSKTRSKSKSKKSKK